MPTSIFDTQGQFEGSGSYFVSGTSTLVVPGTLMLDETTAFCKGPVSISYASFDNRTAASMSYAWKIHTSASAAGLTVFFDRSDINFANGFTPIENITLTQITTQPIAVDIAIDEHGYYIFL